MKSVITLVVLLFGLSLNAQPQVSLRSWVVTTRTQAWRNGAWTLAGSGFSYKLGSKLRTSSITWSEGYVLKVREEYKSEDELGSIFTGTSQTVEEHGKRDSYNTFYPPYLFIRPITLGWRQLVVGNSVIITPGEIRSMSYSGSLTIDNSGYPYDWDLDLRFLSDLGVFQQLLHIHAQEVLNYEPAIGYGSDKTFTLQSITPYLTSYPTR